ITRFLKELEPVRRRGWAASLGTTHAGIGAIGAAVASPNEHQPIGFSLSFPLIDADRALRQEIATAVTASAGAIGARIGDPFWQAHERANGGGASAPTGARRARRSKTEPAEAGA